MQVVESEALEENFSVIKAEYEAYRQKLANRKDWDDSDTTPGLGPESPNISCNLQREVLQRRSVAV